MQQNKKGQMSTVTIILIVLIVAMSVAAIAGMVAYNSIQAKNQAKTKTASKSASASKKSKSSNQSTNSRKSSSAASSSSTSSRQSTPELNDRQVGTLLSLYYWPDYFKGLIGDSGIYYGDDQQDGETYHYFTGNGDPTSVLLYRLDGDTITYKYVDASNADCVADAPVVTKTISLKRLINDYYNTSAKRAEVNGYVVKLKPESEIAGGSDTSTADSDE